MVLLVVYLCHNCNDQLLKAIDSVLNHVWDKHKIEVSKVLEPIRRAEDSRMPPKETSRQKICGFRCEDCKVSLSNVTAFFAHLDEIHGIHVWYEKGLTRRRVYFDGILDKTTKNKTEQQSKKNIPLSKCPHEPRSPDE